MTEIPSIPNLKHLTQKGAPVIDEGGLLWRFRPKGDLPSSNPIYSDLDSIRVIRRERRGKIDYRVEIPGQESQIADLETITDRLNSRACMIEYLNWLGNRYAERIALRMKKECGL